LQEQRLVQQRQRQRGQQLVQQRQQRRVQRRQQQRVRRRALPLFYRKQPEQQQR
jgi:hypothetical protein